MRLLDLFCGAGGGAMGYARAGFEVVGIDIKPQPHYPFRFIQADALTYPFDGYDFIHASPPCQRFSIASVSHRISGKEYPDCFTPIHKRLKEWGGIWVIENVVGVPVLSYAIQLCGVMFGLKVFRHRVFQSSHLSLSPEHPSHYGLRIGEEMFSVAGGSGRWKSWGVVQRNVSKGTVGEWRDAMGINWMTRKELTQSIPPAYTEYLGRMLAPAVGLGTSGAHTQEARA